ncbi:MAG: trypsin-like peptidase domain-containing protein [Candidatus Saccharibacteria bacterium]|nr:trypsin-like peptidase domain-containing protein [Candidatus Saccharibacteria bacterium]
MKETVSPTIINQDKKTKPQSSSLGTFFSFLALICAIVSLSVSLTHHNTATIIHPGKDGNSVNFSERSIADIAQQVAPSVVSLTTEAELGLGYATTTASGTGFIISSDGYILTNKHVISGAKMISAVLDNGTTYHQLRLVGVDPLNDVAILQIPNVKNLPAVKFGDSKTINLGQQVIAIGNALGQYQNTVTEGIISGIGRSIIAADAAGNNREALSDMIQTDASINQGNSGGPLVNAAGEVIGINTAITGNSLGFAIPISSVKGIVKQVLKTGEFKRAYLGIYYTNVNASIAKTYNLPHHAGAYLQSNQKNPVIKDSAADRAGLKAGDLITAVNGVEIGKHGTLSSLIGEYAIGETVKLTISRDGQVLTIDITLAEYKN